MHRRNVLLLAVAGLLAMPYIAHASVIIKTVPHANVKMEFGAQHVPPHDVALLDESAKVDGTTRLGIEVPHSQNHRNVLIHKIGTYLTVVMKALAKTVAPSQNQDGKTHFDIHVDADLGENDSKDKKDEPAHVTIVHSTHGEGEQGKSDCVKAVVIVSESEREEKKEEHKSSEKHHKDEHKKTEEIVLHHSAEESKSHYKQDIHQELEGKLHLSKEEKKEDPFKFQPPKDWDSFKKTQEMLKEKGFILQLDKSFFATKENQGKQSHKTQTVDLKKNIKLSHEGKSLSEEEMDESERNWKSLELTEADPEALWISMVHPVDADNSYQQPYQTNKERPENNSFPKTETVHMSPVNNPSKGDKLIQTVKTTTYQSVDGPVIVTTSKSVNEVPPKQTFTSERSSPMRAEHPMSYTTNEIPSLISSHFQQTSYSSDRSRGLTVVKQDPIFDSNKGGVSQPVVYQVKDKLTEVSESTKTLPHIKIHGDSHEVIMRLAPASKTAANKKVQTIDVKKIKIPKPDLSVEEDPDGTATRLESVRKLPMANIPTLIDVLQNSPPQEVQRLTELASGGMSQESQRSVETGYTPVAQTNITDSLSSKSPRDFPLPEPNEDVQSSEEQKGLVQSSETALSGEMSSKSARNEKLNTNSKEILVPNGKSMAEKAVEESISEHLTSQEGLEVTGKSNPDVLSSAEEPRSLKYIPENPIRFTSMEDHVDSEPERQQKELEVESAIDEAIQKSVDDADDHEGERIQKSFPSHVSSLEVEDKAHGSPLTEAVAVGDIVDDARASHALTLSSLTTSAEEARALDISSPVEVENKPSEVPLSDITFVEEAVPTPKNLKQEVGSPKQEPEISDTDKASEEARLEKSVTSPSLAEQEGEHKKDSSPEEPSSVNKNAAVLEGPKEVTSSDNHIPLPLNDTSAHDISPTTTPPTVPSLPENEGISLPAHKERGLSFEDDANMLISNLVELNEEVPADDVDRDGRIYNSLLGTNTLLAPPNQHAVILPELSVTTPITPLNNAIPFHDPKSPSIYSYYPTFYPKEVYDTQNKSEEAQGMYGRPSPRVICVNTDTGKVLGDAPNIGDQNNVLTKFSAEVTRSNKDDNLMLLKLLHEDIQKLKQQLKIQ